MVDTHATASAPRRDGRRTKERFVVAAGRALHTFGSPAHRLEAAMAKLARQLGLEGQFFSTPTAIFASFGADRARSTRLIRADPGDVDIERLTAVDRLLDRVVAGELAADRAAAAIDAVVAAPPRYGALVATLSFAAVSGPAARFFGGGWTEVAVATAIGLVTGLLALAGSRWPASGRLLYPLAAMLAAALATVAAARFGPMSIYVVTLAGLIALLPGLTLTVAMTELATGHLVSGAARLAGAMLVFLTLGFGVGLGRHLGSLLVGASAAGASPPLAAWTEWPALALIAGAFTVQFRAHPRDAGWILVAGVVAIHGGRLGGQLLGPELGAFLGAVLVGVAANLFARLRRRTATLIQLPGLMLLVPGSVGFSSLDSLLAHDTLSGVQAAFGMTLVAIALVTGLLVANVVVDPRRSV